tara:strand:- start:3842 stop:4618 length:777 start_codon:yes stop_codon:yes gene_type:complete
MTLNVQPGFLWNDSIWNPSMISTALWLDANDASTITQGGGTVSQWNDKSGNGRNAIQSLSNRQPAYNSTGFNSRPTLTFDGAEDFMVTPAFTVPTDFTLVAVCTLLANGSYPILLHNGGFELRGVAATAQPSIASISANDGAGILLVPATPVTTTDSLLNTTNILIGQVIGTSTTLRQNGSLRDTRTSTAVSTSLQFRSIGARLNGSLFANARISELIELGNVSVPIQERIEGYLAHKWGLEANLPNDHPYKTTGPIP